MAAEEAHDHPHDEERYAPNEEISINAFCRCVPISIFPPQNRFAERVLGRTCSQASFQ
jgi:hypothetical protein